MREAGSLLMMMTKLSVSMLRRALLLRHRTFISLK
jgi:hypothetical protein